MARRAEHLAEHVQLAHREQLRIRATRPSQQLHATERRGELPLVLRGGGLQLLTQRLEARLLRSVDRVGVRVRVRVRLGLGRGEGLG